MPVLVDSKEVEKLVVSLHALLDRSGLNPGDWVINESSLDIDVRAFDMSVMMQSCDGPGVLALISAALARDGRLCCPQEVKVDDLNTVVGEELETDCRGDLDVTPRNSAYIDIGEIKKGVAYSTAITQFGIRLSVIAWLVHECCEVPSADIRRIGRLFIPWGNRQFNEDEQQKLALDDWQFSLYHFHEI